jgi:hypothetical protein
VAWLGTLLGIWAVASVLLAWGLLPDRWRAAVSIVLSVAGLVFLTLATGTEGFRETQSTTVFLLGPPQVTALASASASLPYYVLTAACLLLGGLGLVTSQSTAPLLSRHYVAWAVALSLFVIAIRVLLEKAAAPSAWSYLFGVTWLAPVVGAFFHLRLRAEGAGLLRLASWLLAYGLAVRAAVAATYVAFTQLRLGTHYDLSSLTRVLAPWGSVYSFEPGGFSQLWRLAILPQLLIWPFFTVVSGLLGAAMLAVVLRFSRAR